MAVFHKSLLLGTALLLAAGAAARADDDDALSKLPARLAAQIRPGIAVEQVAEFEVLHARLLLQRRGLLIELAVARLIVAAHAQINRFGHRAAFFLELLQALGEDVLLERMEARAQAATESGNPRRSDDDPRILRERIRIYKERTAPLADYYLRTGRLKTVAGLASIEHVSEAIDHLLRAAAAA